VKSLLCALAAFLAIGLASCGGGGVSFPPPTPSGSFVTSSLKGQYAFSMSGVVSGLCAADSGPGAYIARVGSFVADGNGNITSGLEDVLDLGSGQAGSTVSFTGGNYSIQPNGRGLIALQGANGGGLQLNFDLQSNSSASQASFAGFLVQTDLCATSSGTFVLQNTASFSTSALSGHYVFDFSGVSFGASSVAPISMIGFLNADSNGNFTTGVMDTHDGNATAPSGPTAIAAGTYQLDPSANGTTYGRGTMTFNGYSYAFYIADATHLYALEEDNFGGTSGEARQQATVVPLQNSDFTGSFVYLIGGASVLGTQGPIAREARFTADGNGGIAAISFEDNNNGGYTHISQGSNISNATYAIDTANSGTGRGTFTFADSGAGTFSDVFYMISSTQALVQETSRGVIGDGPLYAQTGSPFSVSASAANYVFNWSGVQLSSSATSAPFEEDFIGQYALSSATTSNISGVTDYVELGIGSKNLYTDVGLGGTLTITGDGTANNLYKFVLGGSPSTTINFQAYFVNPTTVLLVCSDSTRATAGIIRQQAP
jgi:hypothetical protein